MAKLSKVDAAKAAGVSRQTLYTYLKDGRLSADADGLIDTVELLRAGFTLHPGHESGRLSVSQGGQGLTSSVDTLGQPLTSKMDMLDIYLDMITMLKQQLSDAQAREHAALEREQVARDREALLLQMLQDMQQRYDRLLDLPRIPTQTTSETRQDAPGATQTLGPPETRPRERTQPQASAADVPPGISRDPRGDMRRRIIALLQTYTHGLTPAEIRDRLGVGRNLGDTLLGMLRYGLVRRVGRGRYVAPAPRTP